MKPLDGHKVIALGSMGERPLARVLEDLGAEIVSLDDVELVEASFLLDDLGLERLAEMGLRRARVERANPALIQVSVTTFGSGGPRELWRGGELVASAMGGTLRLCGEADRPPVKEALDACTFHADMVAAAGALSAHYARGSHGYGQHVDISIQQVAFSRSINSVISHGTSTSESSRA